MITLYDYLPSQNAYKVRLLLNHLQRKYRTIEVSIFEGEGQKSSFLDISPTGAVPAIVLDDGRSLAESNAILSFLANGTDYLPGDPYARAKVQQWLFFEADYIQAGIATLRHWRMTGKDKNRPETVLSAKQMLCEKTLSILDRALTNCNFLAGDHYTIADMSVFAYVHRVDEAGIPLRQYSSVARWVETVKSQELFLDEMFDYSIDPHSNKEL